MTNVSEFSSRIGWDPEACPLKKPMHSVKKRALIIIAGLLAVGIIAVGVTAFILEEKVRPDEPAFYVDGVPVAAGEFADLLNARYRTAALAHFSEMGEDISDTETFWNRKVGDTTPAEYARSLGFDEMVRIKVIQTLMKEHGIQQDISYSAFLEAFSQENDSRKNAVSNGEVIYGPETYQRFDYYTYLFSNNQNELERALFSDALKPGEQQMREWFLQNGEQFRTGGQLTLFVITLPYRGDNRESVKQLAHSAAARIGGGEDAKAVSEQLAGCTVQTVEADQDSGQSLPPAVDRIGDGIELLKALGATEVFDLGEACCIMNTQSFVSGVIPSFEEAKTKVSIRYQDMIFKEYIDNLTAKAEITYNRKIYERVTP